MVYNPPNKEGSVVVYFLQFDIFRYHRRKIILILSFLVWLVCLGPQHALHHETAPTNRQGCSYNGHDHGHPSWCQPVLCADGHHMAPGESTARRSESISMFSHAWRFSYCHCGSRWLVVAFLDMSVVVWLLAYPLLHTSQFRGRSSNPAFASVIVLMSGIMSSFCPSYWSTLRLPLCLAKIKTPSALPI